MSRKENNENHHFFWLMLITHILILIKMQSNRHGEVFQTANLYHFGGKSVQSFKKIVDNGNSFKPYVWNSCFNRMLQIA